MAVRALVCYSAASTFTATTAEYVKSFSLHPEFDVNYLHVTHGSDPDINLNSFDCIFISYCARLCFPGYVSEKFLSMLRSNKGVTGIFIQDEYDYVNNEINALRAINPTIIFTCIPQSQIEKVYPKKLFKTTQFVNVLTGYIPENIPTIPLKKIADRQIDIGYRGRDISPRYGKLGNYKYHIGKAFLSCEKCKDLKLDVRMDEASRIYGARWYEWLAECKVTLGTPSGSNIFDFDGSIAESFKSNNNNSTSEIPEKILKKIESLDEEFDMGQISPRVFEATAMGCGLILIKGNYSNILSAGKHYLPLEPDFSNISEIVDAVKDNKLIEEIATATHTHLIKTDNYSYLAFADLILSQIKPHLDTKKVQLGQIQGDPSISSAKLIPPKETATKEPLTQSEFFLRQLVIGLSSRPARTISKITLIRLNSSAQSIKLKAISKCRSIIVRLQSGLRRLKYRVKV